MRILTIGDPHFKVSNIEETDIMCNEIIKVCDERKPDLIVILGDILDRHELIHVSPLSRAIDFFKKLLELNIELFILIGNHDLKNNKQYLSDEHPFTSLKLLNNLTIVDKPLYKIINNFKFTFVPYIPPGRFIEALNLLDNWKDSKCIFAHQEFRGVNMGCIISTEGDLWDITYPLVISGHIHGYNKLQNNIIYTGTPIQHNFGDSIDKSISLFNFNINDIEEERIYLNFIKKYTFNINYNDIDNFNPLPGNNKIIISGTLAEIKSLDKNKKINEWKKNNYKVLFKNINNDNFKDLDIKIKEKFSVLLFNSIKHDDNLINTYKTLI